MHRRSTTTAVAVVLLALTAGCSSTGTPAAAPAKPTPSLAPSAAAYVKSVRALVPYDDPAQKLSDAKYLAAGQQASKPGAAEKALKAQGWNATNAIDVLIASTQTLCPAYYDAVQAWGEADGRHRTRGDQERRWSASCSPP